MDPTYVVSPDANEFAELGFEGLFAFGLVEVWSSFGLFIGELS
jgi:hypothetical protein